jgi:signal transduction histidine kinase
VREIYPDAESEKIIREFERAMRDQQTIIRTAYHAGFKRWLEIRAFPTPEGVSVFFKDVSAQVKAEQALRENEQQFRVLTQNLVSAVSLVNERGEMTIVNKSFLRLFELADDTVIRNLNSRDWSQWKVFDEAGHLLDVDEHPVRKAARTRMAVRDALVAMQCPGQAARKWVLISAEPILDARGELHRLICTYHDITERKRAEEALRRTMEELQRSNKELERFAYIASHDLQEPLRQVVGFGNLLGQRYGEALDEKGREFMRYMIEGSQRMSALVKGLLEYSRVGRGGTKPMPLAADEALDATLTNLRLTIEESGACIVRSPLARVVVDPVQLGQLFQNLIGNALKFRREGVVPEIEVGCRAEGGMCTFWVKDNGIGIAPELHEKIFVIFQRLHGVGKYPGTGIGLTICKKIVEHHGGRIWIESVAGEGSTFFFTLPLAKEVET